ncbi:nucleotide-diphospho-sugar transferase [Lophiotrema nucula]|uniref:Nucleotide-diphospho-sugar transferase n=1 Tax=Lophiotrema nucula TaxID=690887 RepID=A0A6A5Z6J5_9PLEO|nr:nucleotide-diphospho-sugar transferase [Lophiotrema nucula]
MRRDIRVLLYTGFAAAVVLTTFITFGKRPSLNPASKFRPYRDEQPKIPPQYQGDHIAHGSAYANQFGWPDTQNETLAYVTWLSSTVAQKDGQKPEDDVYFIGTRILVWQLLHYEPTKAKGIDVVVLVTPDVDEQRRLQLRKDGAMVRPIEFVHGKHDAWLHPKEGRWNDIMSKLRAWEMTEYSRILMLDGDMILRYPLDGIFNDPAAQPAKTNVSILNPPDEVRLPSEYLLASIGEVAGAKHAFPPDWDHGLKKRGYFCAGFFMLKPNKQIFKYYTDLLDIENRFSPVYMEQNLLNYAHRWDGPAPWKELSYAWNIRSVNDNDLDQGVVSMHEKWWEEPFSHSERVKGIFHEMRWKMEGYYLARNDEVRKQQVDKAYALEHPGHKSPWNRSGQ